MKEKNGKKGTTIFELILVMGIIVVISAVSLLSVFKRKGYTDLTNTAQQMSSLLREARSRSVSQSSSTNWGVHFMNSTTTAPFFALFYSQTYGTSTTVSYYKLPATVGYQTTAPGYASSTDVTFTQISGLASASTSITIYVKSGSAATSSLTISVASSGAVSY